MSDAPAPLVSVVIPSYNHETYVAQALDSVLNDPYPNKEIVIIDDGSSDSTLSVIKSWQSKYKDDIDTHVLSQSNKGVCITTNKGIRLAKGAFIVLLASDDYLLPGSIQMRVDYLLDNPNILCAIGDAIVVDEDSKQTHKSAIQDFFGADTSHYKTPQSLARSIICHWALPGPIILARKELFETIGYYDEERVIEDWDFFLRMAAKEVVGYIDKPVAAYRWHSANAERGMQQKRLVLEELYKTGLKRIPYFGWKLRPLIIAKTLYYWLRLKTHRPS